MQTTVVEDLIDLSFSNRSNSPDYARRSLESLDSVSENELNDESNISDDNTEYTYEYEYVSELDDQDSVAEKPEFFESLTKSTQLKNSMSDDSTSGDGDSITENDDLITFTDNHARSYSTSSSALVDFFFKMVRGLTEENLTELAEASWQESPIDTIKIAFHARDCRGGKGERKIFFMFMNWLCEKSLISVLENLEVLPEYGRWLDLIELSVNEEIAEIVWLVLAHRLRLDQLAMLEGKPVSLAAKWIPSEGSHWDKKLKATKLIAKELGVSLRELRQTILTPLRSYLKVVEKYMCDQKWDQIDYNKVPGVAMNKLKKAFERNDKDRFDEWKLALANGRPDSKVNAKVVFPHELVKQYLLGPFLDGCEYDQVIESQWKVLVEETAKLGNFGRSLVISDVSGSMTQDEMTPLAVSVALGLIFSSLCAEPFKGKIITFSEKPTFHDVKGESLFDQVNDVRNMDWGENTNLTEVFGLILDKALEYGVPPDNMPERLYILSDMQFDEAVFDNKETNYESIKRMYSLAGYSFPEIVFWNLAGDTFDFPIGDSNEKGVALVSGFTTSILQALLSGKEITPYGVLRAAIDNPRYDAIKFV